MSKHNNILILTYWSFKDALIQTYTLPYVRIIRKQLSFESKIYLLTLEQKHLSMSAAEWKNQCTQFRSEGIYLIRFSYSGFGITAIFKASLLILYLLNVILIRKVKTIHAWCTPAGALAYVLSLITRRKLIIDSYEPHAEAMVENGTWKKNSFAFKLLWWFERKQSKKAFALIATTFGMKQYCKEKYNVEPKQFFVKPSCVDLNLFDHNLSCDNSILDGFEIENKIVAIYAGKFGGIYLDQEVFDFFKVAFQYWGDKLRVIILTNTLKEQIINKIKLNGLNADNFFIKFVFHKEIPKFLRLADFAINPVKPVPTKRYCTSIKDGEYWAMGLPIVIPDNISDDSDIIKENNIGYVFKSLNENEYLNSIKVLEELIKEKGITNRIRKIAEEYRSIKIAENIYNQIY